MKLRYFLAFTSIAILSFTVGCRAGDVVNENWESYSPGSLPVAPWQQINGGGTSPGVSKITVVKADIGPAASNWLLIDNAATNEPTGNPVLLAGFPEINTKATLSFDYSIPENYGNASQIFLTISSGTRGVIKVLLGRNYEKNGMAYYNEAGAAIGVGHSFSAGEIIHLELTNIDFTTRTYDFVWKSSEGGKGKFPGILFTKEATSIDRMMIGEGSPTAGTSKIYVGNIKLQTMP